MRNMQIEPILHKDTTDWQAQFLASSKDRALYELDDSKFRFSRIAVRVLGVPVEEDDYFNALFDMAKNDSVHVLSEELDKYIDPKDFQAVQAILKAHQETPKGLSINRLVAMMYGHQLIPQHPNAFINKHLQLTMIKIIELFKEQQAAGLLSNEFRRFLIDMIKWLKNHWAKWSQTLDIGDEFPKVVWYGESTISQRYFLLLLMELGCDVLVFSPTGTDEFSAIDPEEQWSVVYRYATTTTLQPFPDKLRERQATVGYRSSKHFDKLMHDQQSGVYKPWQFKEHLPRSITLRTTYDDIFIYGNEKAMVRPEFKVVGEQIYIPVIFAKIAGISANREEYWENMHKLIQGSNSQFVKAFPYMKTSKANFQFHYNHCLENNELSPAKMMTSDWWQYGQLQESIQKAIAHTIKDCCENPSLLPLAHEKEIDLQLFMFKAATMIPIELLRLLQNFDYSQEIPRLVLYHSQMDGELSREDAALLVFLNRFGVDIILYNPTGKLDMELYMEKDIFDVHLLEHMVFDQPYQEPKAKPNSIIKKFIHKFL
ncbi:YceG family protein [Viridibacillus arvi]|uniref:YceG family protein n=1 Tax=Viridibacillus arvi TaxID=263475 RepID=UPI003CFC0533